MRWRKAARRRRRSASRAQVSSCSTGWGAECVGFMGCEPLPSATQLHTVAAKHLLLGPANGFQRAADGGLAEGDAGAPPHLLRNLVLIDAHVLLEDALQDKVAADSAKLGILLDAQAARRLQRLPVAPAPPSCGDGLGVQAQVARDLGIGQVVAGVLGHHAFAELTADWARHRSNRARSRGAGTGPGLQREGDR